MDAPVVEIKRRRGKTAIDKALNGLMRQVTTLPPDVAVKVIATAIAWEKVKAKIQEDGEKFDPDEL